jgi:hypothetical protein
MKIPKNPRKSRFAREGMDMVGCTYRFHCAIGDNARRRKDHQIRSDQKESATVLNSDAALLPFIRCSSMRPTEWSHRQRDETANVAHSGNAMYSHMHKSSSNYSYHSRVLMYCCSQLSI